ncbi:hypothetical protein [Edaphovirga cremea]|uniref:hypothetical protein n=1 Tax=Edaphovirga cremea TaxID=2267246 RepID=UPI000DEF5102|nr:hypothetical protein [Edaphovirga cremea]
MNLFGTVDLTAVARAQQKEAVRQLVYYLQRHYGTTLHRLPTDVDTLKDFITQTQHQANQQGYGSDELFTFFIISSFLLGSGWLQDPVFTPLITLLTDSGIDSDLTSRLHHCQHQRQRLEAALPALHDSTITLLESPMDRLPPETLSKHWQVMAQLRGVPADQSLPELYRCYETDFRQLAGLPAKNTGIKTPTPDTPKRLPHSGMPQEESHDFSNDQAHEQRHQLLLHLHLALGFGRYYRTNRLHKALHQALNTPVSERSMALIQFLRTHQQRLKENTEERE